MGRGHWRRWRGLGWRGAGAKLTLSLTHRWSKRWLSPPGRRAELTLTLRGHRRPGRRLHLLDCRDGRRSTCATGSEFAAGDGLGCRGGRGSGSGSRRGDENLVRRALAAAGRQAFVRLHKRIPAGAGLGGGSADAAAVLRWAGVTELRVAARLGADVPFCLVGGRARVRGVGEQVDPLPFDGGRRT